MTAPRRSGAEQATTRGLIVLFVAFVIGAALLAKSDALVGTAQAGKAKPATTTTTALSSTTQSTVSPINTGGSTPSGSVHPTAEVHVVIVNASGKSGVGKKNQQTLATAKFNCTDADVKTGRPLQAATTVYYADGYQADAEAVKAALAVTDAKVAALPADAAAQTSAAIPAEGKAANVVVVFGQSYQP